MNGPFFIVNKKNMIDYKQFLLALDQIAEEKKISKEKIIETLEMALAAAYKKDYGKKGEIVRAKFDLKTGKFEVFQVKLVVDESMIKPETEEELAQEAGIAHVSKNQEYEDEFKDGEMKKVRFNPDRHIMIEEAKKIDKNLKPGDELITTLEQHEDFGRIAAQTAKQVITQRIREEERSAIYEDYKNKEGEVVSGMVQRIEGRTVYIDLDRVVGILFPEEQIAKEYYRIGARLRVFVLSVQQNPKGPMVLLSRSHPKFVSKLFEFEVPEIASSIVEIKAVAREAGSRTKIAAISHEKGIDPIGSLVGQKGTRVNTVISELGGEKIDIMEWSEDPIKFIAAAIAPAKASEVSVDEQNHTAIVLVPEEQLSLAIGRGGQNVRLAARLTGWRIDVRSAAAPEKSQEEGIAEAVEKKTETEIINGVEKVADGVEIIHGEEGEKIEHTKEVEEAVQTAEKKEITE